MKLKLLLLSLILLFGFSIPARSQWVIMSSDADSLVRIGSYYIYNVQFDSAEVCFKKVISLYPGHPAGYFLEAMIDWWKISLFKNKHDWDKSFENKIQKVVDICDGILDTNSNDINALFFKAGALGYRGRYYATRDNWIKAASDGASAFKMMIECQKIAPSNHDIMLGTGIYNYFTIAIPEQMPFVKPLLSIFPKGDKSMGIYQLRAAAKYARYASVEAKVVLLQIYYSFEHDNQKTLEIVQDLVSNFPNNPYFHRYLGRVYVRMGLSDLYEKTWREILLRCMDKKTGYDGMTAREAMYYVGTALMNRGQLDLALKYFYKCDEGCRTYDDEATGFMVNTNIAIGNIYDLQGKRSLAIMQYKKVLNWSDYENSHKKAENYIDNPYKR